MGENLHEPRDSNPKGFFEDVEINHLNERMLERMLPQRGRLLGVPDGYGWDIPDFRHRWLARAPLDARGLASADDIARIMALTTRKPFCFKDPRFCYTLDLWRPFARDPKFICVFRSPASFVSSVFAECLSAPYLRQFAISVDQLLDVWVSMYRHVLERHSREGDWIFVSYEKLVAGGELDRLENFAGATVDRSFVDAALNRRAGEFEWPESVKAVYGDLISRSNANDAERPL